MSFSTRVKWQHIPADTLSDRRSSPPQASPMKHLSSALILGLMLLTGATQAQAQTFSIGARAGTLGPGVEISTQVFPYLNVRAGANYLAYARNIEVSDLEVTVDADSRLQLSSGSLLVDYLPFSKVLRLSGGLVYNNNNITSVVMPTESYTIEGKTFSPERIGSIDAKIRHGNRLQPYLGLGLGNPSTGRITPTLDLGFLYTDAPSLSMHGHGMIAPTAGQAADLEAAFYSFKWYPVVAVGFSVRI